MIIDTLVVVVCFMVDTPKTNRFEKEFLRADSLFEQASKETSQNAAEKTKKERENILHLFDMQTILNQLNHNAIKP